MCENFPIFLDFLFSFILTEKYFTLHATIVILELITYVKSVHLMIVNVISYGA